MSPRRRERQPRGDETRQIRECVFDERFVEDLQWWVRQDRRTAERLIELVQVVLRDPFQGIGKPEPLRYLGSNAWSRRLTDEHRLVYQVFNDRIHLLQGRYHY